MLLWMALAGPRYSSRREDTQTAQQIAAATASKARKPNIDFSFSIFETSQRSHNCVNAKAQIIFRFQFHLTKLRLPTTITREAKAITDQQLILHKIRTVNFASNVRAVLLKN